MDYIFYYYGKLPKHIRYCFESIKKSDPNSRIILCTNSKTILKNVEIISPRKVESYHTKEIRNISQRSDNTLWLSSLLRIFYNLNVAKYNSISKFIHFDTDVLVYKSYEELKHLFNEQQFNITPLNEQLLVFGYSYVGNLSVYQELCDLIFHIVLNQEEYEKKYLKNQKFNEMAALYIAYKIQPDIFNFLPTLPNKGSSLVFDPASYGQFIGGVYGKKFSKGYATKNHIVGSEILNKNILPKYEKSGPIVLSGGLKYEIANLHIHKKTLKKYIK